MSKHASEPEWLTTTRLAELLGVSQMTVWRWEHHPDYLDLRFPKPAIINARRYWSRDEINVWMRARIVQGATGKSKSKSAA